MDKEMYQHTDLEIIEFQTDDVIMTSNVNHDDAYEGEMP